jgi:hypothetical protein
MKPEGSLRFHTSKPPNPILSQINLIHTALPDFPKIHFNTIPTSIPASSEWSPPTSLSNENYVRISHLPMHATFAAHPALNVITLIISEEEYKLWSSSFGNLLQSYIDMLYIYLNTSKIIFESCSAISRSWDSSFSIVSDYRLHDRGTIAGRGRSVFSVSRPALGPTQPPVQCVKHGRGVTLTTHPHLVPRS